MTSFSELGLAAPIQKALVGEGYDTPTPIQAQAIPYVMEGRDLCGIAQTGTGKTAAFALPILHRLAGNPKGRSPRACRVLVLSPTRELASQIADSFKVYGRNLRLSTEVIFGGVPLGRQERALAGGIDVLVATPGRLLDLIDRRALTLSQVEILVLDEADQMLDLGFIHALKRIVTLLPKERQTLFFSATMPKTISALADQYLRDPARVSVTPVATTAERVEQEVIFVPQQQKQALLTKLLGDPAIERVLVFTRTKHGADKVVRALDKAGVESAAIHGNKSQSQRERALASFKTGQCRVLVATDIAARGIDVEAVTHVINFELPNVPESYVHRIGRTARAGAAGLAISFCNEEEKAYLKDIERLTRSRIPVAPLPKDLPVLAAPEPDRRPADAGRGGQGRPGGGRGGPSQRGGQPQRGQQGQRHAEGRPGGGGRPSDGRGASHEGVGRQAPRPEGGRGRAAEGQGRGRPGSGGQRSGGGGGDGRSIGWISGGDRRSPR